jgi:hypothetical protein
MNQAQKQTASYHVAPVIGLILLAPTIAEILLGDLLLNDSFVPTLLMYLLLYGSGALLVREVARRLHLGWSSIIVLALAYGVVEEGLVLQTFFNQHFPGLEVLATYGRALGVSWFWIPSVLGMHAVWSITLPILLTERLFPTLASRPWLGRVGLGLDAIIYVLTALVMFRFFTTFTHFSASPLALLLTALAVVILVGLALLLLPRWIAVSGDKGVPTPWVMGLVVFVAGVLFFTIQVFFPAVPAIAPLLPILLYGALYAGMVLLIWRWATGSKWTVQHQLALASGALLTYMLYGFRLSARGGLVDLIFHGVICVVIICLLVWMFSRYAQGSSVSWSVPQRDEREE